MSRLRELMEELCPNGVEYKKLGEIAEIIRGNGLQKKDFVNQGIGCIHYGQIYTRYGAFADRTLTYVTPQLAATLKPVSTGDLVVAITSENVEDVCKCVAWLGEDDIVTGGINIPIPPLEIQQKIVSILDRFDTLCGNLTSDLSAEIAARKRQYEHYRDKLLTFPRSKLEERS